MKAAHNNALKLTAPVGGSLYVGPVFDVRDGQGRNAWRRRDEWNSR